MADVPGMDTQQADLVAARADDGGAAGAAPYEPIVSPIEDVLRVRPGVAADLDWIDRLQKANSRAVGFLQRSALEGKVRLGQVLVATVIGRPAGYLIASDRYLKRDELGLITQVNVEPAHRRSLVAARLVQAQFDRSAYGCRLYSCWCAQDLEANAFWEAMGFVPIAFRTGSEGRGKGRGPRVHLFWQKRVRAGDGSTPWWYPCKTDGGQLRADRVAFPVPPGTHWRHVEPVALAEQEVATEPPAPPTAEEAEADAPAARVVWPAGIEERDGQVYRGGRRLMTVALVKRELGVGDSAMWFVPEGVELVREMPEPTVVKAKPRRRRAAKARPAAARKTIDPKVVELSRELRDRWQEQIEQRPWLVAPARARHDVRRRLAGPGGGAATLAEVPTRQKLLAA